jgi:hypothetical protein
MTRLTVFRNLRILLAPALMALAVGLIGCKSEKQAKESPGQSGGASADVAAAIRRPEPAPKAHGSDH